MNHWLKEVAEETAEELIDALDIVEGKFVGPNYEFFVQGRGWFMIPICELYLNEPDEVIEMIEEFLERRAI